MQNVLDSQGFLKDLDRPTVFASFPSPPESLVSETTPAPATIIPEVVVLDSSHPPEVAESDLGSTAADAASAYEMPAESDFGSAAADAVSASETSSTAVTSADPIHVPVKPVPKILGRRAPALLTEPINLLSRVRAAPVLVTSRPKSTPDIAASSANTSQEDMDTSSTLKRKHFSAKEKKVVREGNS